MNSSEYFTYVKLLNDDSNLSNSLRMILHPRSFSRAGFSFSKIPFPFLHFRAGRPTNKNISARKEWGLQNLIPCALL